MKPTPPKLPPRSFPFRAPSSLRREVVSCE
jgi:hypothetical protein